MHLLVKCHNLASIISRSHHPHCYQDTLSPGLQKIVTTEFLNDASVPINSDIFLTALVNGGTSRLSCLTQYIHFSPHASLRFVISSSPCLPGGSVILHLAGPSVVAQPFSKLPRTTLAVCQHRLLRSPPVLNVLSLESLHIKHSLIQLYVPLPLSQNPQDPGPNIFSWLFQVYFGKVLQQLWQS